MAANLVIVESPTKAKTIKKFLDKKYTVKSSYGHLRDLPKKEMGVDVEKEFAPKYVVPPKSKKNLTAIKKAAEAAKEVYFATDEDREGEAISWHLATLLKIKPEDAKRITFTEITKTAILEALKDPHSLDLNLVDAQQARRVLDRLVGYELSPFLWKKIKYGLSAGRVQSVAVRLIVEREREIQAFKPKEYWTIDAELLKGKESLVATLVKDKDKLLKKFDLGDEKVSKQIIERLKGAQYQVVEVRKKEKKRTPPPPFTTSTLQQAASRKLGYSAKQTMMIAQQLYEGVELGSEGPVGLITYMRTDSLHLANSALQQASEVISQDYGDKYALKSPRNYKTKSKGAQEAHEAIRPTDLTKRPEDVSKYLDDRQSKLYNLIWRRTLASQMTEAILDSTAVDIQAGKDFIFRANGLAINFDGFLKVYQEATNGGEAKEVFLPNLKIGDQLDLKKLSPLQHFTLPPARYSEAGLVKKLEELGIGRPSTYAPTMSTIQDRGYVIKEDKRFHPTDIGTLVNDVLVDHFPKIVDYEFTAEMEEKLDKIAQGKQKWVPVIQDFYDPFKDNLAKKDKELTKKDLTEEKSDEVCDKCNSPMVIKMGRFGKFMACSNYPDCKNTKPLKEEQAEMEQHETKETCPDCKKPLTVKRSRYGMFLGCTGYPDCKYIKKIEKETGAKCPECGKGEIIEKSSRRGRLFYACNQYPKCEFALWQKPTGAKCPECQSLIVYAAKNKLRCSNKECDHEQDNDQNE